MHGFKTCCPLVLGVLALCVGVTYVQSKWVKTIGLDFWNLGKEESEVELAKARSDEIDQERIRLTKRFAECDRITERLYDRKVKLSEAIDSMLILLEKNPKWLAFVKQWVGLFPFETDNDYFPLTKQTIRTFLLSSTGGDRDVTACFLLTRIESMHIKATLTGNKSMATAISTRLNELEVELWTIQSQP
jgi:hypothetical protein